MCRRSRGDSFAYSGGSSDSGPLRFAERRHRRGRSQSAACLPQGTAASHRGQCRCASQSFERAVRRAPTIVPAISAMRASTSNSRIGPPGPTVRECPSLAAGILASVVAFGLALCRHLSPFVGAARLIAGNRERVGFQHWLAFT